MQEYLIAKQTVEHILGIDWKNEEEKRQKEQEQQAQILADSYYGE